MLHTTAVTLTVVSLVALYLWNAGRALRSVSPEIERLVQKQWTKTEIRRAYAQAQSSPTDVKPFLFTRRDRRYIVAGGSGLVGGWIVAHLLMRGEDPQAIRIVDLSHTKRKEAIAAQIDCVVTDVSNKAAVQRAFAKEWPSSVRDKKLTVFHTVAYIDSSDRKADFQSLYAKVNIAGTMNMLDTAKAFGATAFIATSSGSVGVKAPSYFPLPWRRWPANICQILDNAEPEDLSAPVDSFPACYTWSKAQAELVVSAANTEDFLTGIIRPGHAIYGHGVDNPSSLTWEYLRRGGSPTWIEDVISSFVCAQNVSIAHLAYENALLEKKHSGGKAYCVTDPNVPIRYRHLYSTLQQLASPSTPVNFPAIPHLPMVVIAYLIEGYLLIRHRYLPFLPNIEGDIRRLQPGTLNLSTVHLIYDDSKAKREIGYRAPITSIEGFTLAVVEWNKNIEENAKKVMGGSLTGAEVLAT